MWACREEATVVTGTIFAGRRQPLKEGLTAEDLATNEFIDPSIGLKTPAA